MKLFPSFRFWCCFIATLFTPSLVLAAQLTFLHANVGNMDYFNCKSANYKLCEQEIEIQIASTIQNLNPDLISLIEVLPDWICLEGKVNKEGQVCYQYDQLAIRNQARRLLGPDYTIVCASNKAYDCLGVKKQFGDITNEAGEVCPAGHLCGVPEHFAVGASEYFSPFHAPTITSPLDEGFAIMKVDLNLGERPIQVIVGHPVSTPTTKLEEFKVRSQARKEQLARAFNEWLDPSRPTLMVGDFNLDPFQSYVKDFADPSVELWHQYVDQVGPGGELIKLGEYHYLTDVAQGNHPDKTTGLPWYLRLFGFPEQTIDHMVSNFAFGFCRPLDDKEYRAPGLKLDHKALFCLLELDQDEISAFETGPKPKRQKGNLIAMEPHLSQWNYRTEYSFYLTLKSYLKKAQELAILSGASIVTWPEYIGTWLVATGTKRSVFEAETFHEALKRLAWSKPWDFARTYWRHRAEREHTIDYWQATIFRMQAPQMMKSYEKIFSLLAKKYGVTLIAGSVPLPDPGLGEQGQLQINARGPLYHMGAVFSFQGELRTPLLFKHYSGTDEGAWPELKPQAEWGIYDTPMGSVGVMLGHDAWYPEGYEAMEEKDAEFILVPSLARGENVFDTLWGGYSNTSAPPTDVDHSDIDEITQAQAWVKYALPGRMEETNARAGQMAFLRGQFWDLKTDGQSMTVDDKGDIWIGPAGARGLILNHWP